VSLLCCERCLQLINLLLEIRRANVFVASQLRIQFGNLLIALVDARFETCHLILQIFDAAGAFR
jgi:hypothetical protein